MQEEVENRTVTLVISATKLTGRVLKAAVAKFLAHQKAKIAEKKRAGPVKPTGKQTVKQLVGQNQGVANIEISDKNIKDFDRVARKYGVDYAVKKDKTLSPPKYMVFFKARDADACRCCCCSSGRACTSAPGRALSSSATSATP